MRSTARSGSDDPQAARVLEGGFARLRFRPSWKRSSAAITC
jgi:hypothetical protein